VRQLSGLFPATEYPDLLVGLGEPDDAAVFRLDADRALVKTTDFFTPIVDDPWLYGSIAAANAMSDVYAMGGDVIFCLNIAGFPENLPAETVTQIFSGGAAKVREAEAVIAGGHTITSPEPFYGLSVTGLIHPEQLMRKRGLQRGDFLFLTKPLGTGIITTAAKLTGVAESRMHRISRRAQGKPDLEIIHLETAIESMLRLNRTASHIARTVGVRCATDITGFGLLGHTSEIFIASRKDIEDESRLGLRIYAANVPVLPGVLTYIEAGYLTRGSTRNPDYYGEHIHFQATVSSAQRTILWESETSGGLLLAVPAAQVERFRTLCAEARQPTWHIGEVIEGEGIEIV
jgi:selenide,water dikinase